MLFDKGVRYVCKKQEKSVHPHLCLKLVIKCTRFGKVTVLLGVDMFTH